MKRMSLFGAAMAVALAAALIAAPAYAQNTKNYMDQGGSKFTVGGVLDLKAGGSITASGKGSATANSGNSYAVTVNQAVGVITTDSLSTAAGSSQVITVTDSLVTASSVVLHGRAGGTSATGTPSIKAVPGAGTITFTIANVHASAAFNGTFVLDYLVIG